MNTYYEKIQFVKRKISQYLEDIFKVYGNELLLQLEDYNLLANKNNCIETSTATGFIIEEFITSKLEIYTKNHRQKSEVNVFKIKERTTANSSYDCYAEYDNIFFMINIKVQKEGSENNAVAAINILHNDYVNKELAKKKCYIVLKTLYNFGVSPADNQRKIIIRGIDGYCLEEIDFSSGYKQDHRNWSSKFNANSGRLQVPKSWLRNYKLAKEKVSYSRTRSFIDDIYNNTIPEIKK